MLKKLTSVVLFSLIFAVAAFAQSVNDTILVLPFENTSDKPEFNWVGESFALALSDLVKVPGVNVVSNDERKIVQQRLRIPLSSLPSLATSLRLARETNATLLISGTYGIIPADGESAATLHIKARIIRVNEGRFLSEELPSGQRVTRDIALNDALGNLQTMQGQVAYQILYQRDKALPFSQNQLIESANKVPSRAFEAYIKGLLSSNSESKENYFKNSLRLFAEDRDGRQYADGALELGHLFLSQRKTNDAIEYFERVINANTQCKEQATGNAGVSCNDESYAEAAFYIGLIYWQQKNYEQALAVLRPLAMDLKITSVYNTLGAIAIQASRNEKKNQANAAKLLTEGIGLLKQAAASSPEESDVLFNYGLALFQNGSMTDAAEQIRPVIAANPRDGESYFLLAKILEALKDPAAADMDNQARRYLSDNNRYASLESEWQKSKSVENINLRVEQPKRKDFVSVVLVRRTITPTGPAISDSDRMMAQARQAFKNGNDDEALGLITRILSSEPMSAESYLIRGKIALRRGDIDQAISSLKTAIFWDNRQIEAHIALGKIYQERGECLQLKNYSAQALEINADDPEALALQRQAERCSK